MTGPRLATVGYSAMHERLKARYGPASSLPCSDCGAPAASFSLCPCVPPEKVLWEKRPCGWRNYPEGYRWVAYSLDPDDYDPRCTRCHRELDRDFPLRRCEESPA